MTRNKWRLLLPLMVTLLARGLWIEVFPADPLAPVDAQGFQLLAVNLLSGHGFAFGWQAPFCPTALRTPGYPGILAVWYALTGVDASRAVLLHMLLEVLSTALVMHLASMLLQRVGHNRVWGVFLAGMLYALNGITPRYVGVLYAELLFVPCFLAALNATVHLLWVPRARTAVIAGSLWAAATLIKPNIQYLVLMVIIVICAKSIVVYTKYKCNIYVRLALIYSISFGVVLLPLIAKNGLVLGRWQISTAFEENLARVSAVSIMAARDGQTIEPWTETWEHYYDTLLYETLGDQAWVFRAEPAEVCELRASLEPAVTQAAQDLLRDNRWLYVREHIKGVFRGLRDVGHRYWYQRLTGRSWESTGVVADMGKRMSWSLERWALWDALKALWSQRVRDIPVVAGLVWWSLVSMRGIIWSLAFYGWKQLHQRLWMRFLIVLCIGYICFLPGPIAYERFFIPAQPLIYILAAVGMINLPAYNKKHPESSPDIS